MPLKLVVSAALVALVSLLHQAVDEVAGLRDLQLDFPDAGLELCQRLVVLSLHSLSHRLHVLQDAVQVCASSLRVGVVHAGDV